MRVAVAVALGCLTLVGVCAADTVVAAIRKPTDIPAQKLDTALQALAQSRELQVIYGYEVVGEKSTRGAHGELTFEEALAQILSGTGLEYRYLDDHTVTITPVGMTPGAPPAQTDSSASTDAPTTSAAKAQGSFWDRFRVAQVDQGAPGGPVPLDKQAERASQSDVVQLDQVLVTGSRIQTAAGQGSQEVQVYTKEEIDRSGETTIAQFLNTLPSVSTAMGGDGNQTFLGTGTVRLHGLPRGMTLLLIDGRRVESNEYGFFDLNNIPIAAVERIEVLPIGSSAIYGSDALGGAVNVILAKKIDGLEANVKYGQANGTNETDASAAWGISGSHSGISLITSFQHQSELAGYERSVINDARYTRTECDPGNVSSLDGSNLPGLSASQAAIPRGIVGKPGVGAFAASAGLTNNCSYWARSDEIAPTDRISAVLNGHVEIAPALDVFTQIMYSNDHRRSRTDDFMSGEYTVPAGNPFNPFGEAVNVDYSYPGIGQYYVSTASFVRPLVGLRGALWGDWTYELTGSLSKDRTDYFDNYANPTSVATALANTNPAQSLNFFTDGAPGSAQLLQSLVANSAQADAGSSLNQRVGTQGFLRGSLFKLPAGTVQAVVGGEYDRDKSFSENVDEAASTARRTSWAVFTETRVPVLSAPGDRERELLTVTGAVRYDDANDFGGKLTAQGGVEIRPVQSLLFRGSYGTSYRAPLLNELSGAGFNYVVTGYYVDPKRGGENTGTVLVKYGPNPDLQPETGHASDLGMVYTSVAIPGLEVSLTHFAVDIKNYIAWPDTQTMIDNPSYYPGGVVRAAPTAADVANGYAGVITQLNNDYYNFGALSIRGIDFESHYTWVTGVGRFTPSIAATETYRYEAGLAPNAPMTSAVSRAIYSGTGFAPRWKGTVAVDWKLGPYTVAADGRYVGHYLDYQDDIPNQNVLGNFWIVDTSFRYAFGEQLKTAQKWLGQAYAQLGVVNLFNNLPQPTYSFEGFDPTQADIRGRFVYLSLGIRL